MAIAGSAQPRLLDEGEHDPAEAEDAHRRTEHIDAGIGPLQRIPDSACQPEGRGDRNHVDEEGEPPAREVDECAADQRTDDHRARRERGPRSDGLRLRRAIERRCDEGERARHEERSGRALHESRGDEDPRIRRDRDRDRRDTEADEAYAQHERATEGVAGRSGDEHQRAERHEIPVDDPLLRREAAAELAVDRRQGDVDDRAVEERDEGRDDRDPEDP
jgi:hypothetical protein